MNERLECCLCGAQTVDLRWELFRRLRFDGQAVKEYDAGWRCADRDRCRADIEALHRADPIGCPPWNVADGSHTASREAQAETVIERVRRRRLEREAKGSTSDAQVIPFERHEASA